MLRLAILTLALLSSLRGEEWEECRSGPFEVWTNASERETRQMLVKLEQVRHMVGVYLGKSDPVSLWTIRVLLRKGKNTAATDWKLGRDAWVATLPEGSAPQAEWWKQVARMLMESNARRLPGYWEEGLLTFLSTLEAKGPRITLGATPVQTQRTLNWARVHYLATNAEYTTRFRVLMNNLQQGAEEEVAYRNSIGQAKAEVEKQVAAYHAAGQFATVEVSGRAISERDFYTRPIEAPRAAAALEDAGGTFVLEKQPLAWFQQTIASGTAPARVYLEYGKRLTETKAKQEAFVEAAKKNPRWAQPYVELANLEKTPERVAFYLKSAAPLDVRNSKLWQRLAEAQLDAKQFPEASRSWFSAELAAATVAERDAIRKERREFEAERARREDAEKQRIADERQRELDRLREEAMNKVREAEARANKGQTPLASGAKVEEWWDEKTPAKKISGQLQKVDCMGKMARVWVVPAGGGKPAPLLIRDSGNVVIVGGGEAAFGCGVQNPARQVVVEYKANADAKQNSQGDVTLIEFR
ncbi:MAG: hypothetical protein JNK48_14600 [Bryobacterales bacterium]|nr:hypothetical protein [Bryobacterales bacterium]